MLEKKKIFEREAFLGEEKKKGKSFMVCVRV